MYYIFKLNIMKNNILSTILAFFVTAFMYSQDSTSDFSVGDTFLIGDATYNNYEHIDFPKANFIVKKGGLANYQNIKGKKVVVTSIKKENDGKRIATIKLVEAGKFFNSHKYVTVDVDNAVKNKELLVVQD